VTARGFIFATGIKKASPRVRGSATSSLFLGGTSAPVCASLRNGLSARCEPLDCHGKDAKLNG